MTTGKLVLDCVYDNETTHRDAMYMTQPVGTALHTYTWGQALDQARRMASFLKAQNFEPGARIAILSKNCPQFIMAELAIWMAGYTTVAIFPTETPETIRFVLEHSESRLLFVGRLDTWDQQRAGLPADLPCVAFPYAPPSAANMPQWDGVTALHAPMAGRPGRAPTDLALIAYTSGSTGQPKGVMHSFHSFTAGASGIGNYFRKSLPPHEVIRMLSYLPMAHALERVAVVGFSLIDGRVQVFFADSLETFVQDLHRARPTVFISVPRLWLKFQLGVFAKMSPKKLDRLSGLPIVGKLVKRKVLSGLGLDHVKIAISGSAPIPAELITWYKRLGLNLLEAYGMTEDLALSHVSTVAFNAPGYVGVPHDGVQVRISDEGEVLVKSPARLVGYYKRPDLDAESFTEDGYFRTGDKGERLPNGLLKITGRVKELFKTAKGKYVSPAPIENKINASPLVEMSLVSGVGQPRAYAVVLLAENLRPLQAAASFRAETEPQLIDLLRSVNNTLPEHERLQMMVVAKNPWTIESGLLTPTMKVKRSRIEAHVEAAVGAWYDMDTQVVWADI